MKGISFLEADSLKTFFKKFNKVIVALSGGADSAAVLQLSSQFITPENILAVTCVNPHVFGYEIENARKIADSLNINWKPFTVQYSADFLKNDDLRCYYCKHEILKSIENIRKTEGFDAIFDGTNIDDLNDYRPGMKAIKEFNVFSPLKELGISKKDSLHIAKSSFKTIYFNVESCAATRIVNKMITFEDMLKVEKIEDILRYRYPGIRVRVSENISVEFKNKVSLKKSDLEFLSKIIKLHYADKQIKINY
jgi:uncharacterized protein